MATGIELACNLVQAKLATLAPTYLATVPLTMEQYPRAMDDGLCPYAFTWPSEGSWFQMGHGYKVDDRTLTIFVIIESLAQQDIPTRVQEGVRVLEAVRDLFITPVNIPLDYGNTSGYQITVASKKDTPQSDTGLRSDLPFSNKPWFHFRVPLHVRIGWQTS